MRVPASSLSRLVSRNHWYDVPRRRELAIHDRDGGVYYFLNEATEWPKIFQSLADMMATVAEGFNQGIFVVSSDDGAICDRSLEDLLQLGAMLNPSVNC